MSLSAAQRQALVARARRELPEPGDPRRLIDDLLEADLAGPEALQVLSRCSLAFLQLRDLRLERLWQSGFGWFLARNVLWIAFGLLLALLVVRVPQEAVHGLLLGVGAYYLLVTATAPLRLRRHARRRAGILQAYAADLEDCLGAIERGERAD